MKTLVIYDSVFGNTEKVALAIGSVISAASGSPEEVSVVKVGSVTPSHLAGVDILFVGSPTRGFKPTPAITDFLASLPADALKGVKAAAFDTRIPLESIKNPIFRAIVKKGGYADKIITTALAGKCARLPIPSGGFIVLESKGPLQQGELERAAEWAKTIL
jgi:flavodoxin